EHQWTGDQHQRKAGEGPAVEVRSQLRGRLMAHSQPQQAEVDNRNGSDGQSEAHEMQTLDYGERPFGAVHRIRPRTGAQPFKETRHCQSPSILIFGTSQCNSLVPALQWPFAMQVLQAGAHKLIYLELQPEMVANIARQAGFETKAKDGRRMIHLDLTAPGRQGPLLLFDAADPANLGWFSRCQFYVDGRTGAVMQTPLSLANQLDRAGKLQPQAVRMTISKELPASYRLPGKQPLSEQVVYALLYNF